MSRNILEESLMQAKARRNEEFDFDTRYEFLRSHNGLRKGKLHIFLGTPGGGKSTLARSVLIDLIKHNPEVKVKTWLSEESCADYRLEFFKAKGTVKVIENVIIKSELDASTDLQASTDFHEFMKQKSNVTIIDNITTSSLYDGKKVTEQNDYLKKMKTYAMKTDNAVVLIVHTSSDISRLHGKLITANDVRGTRSITNLAEFFYIMQAVNINDHMSQFVFIDKHRGQSPESKIFILKYNKHKKYYDGDIAIKFRDFADMFNDRDKVKK